MLKLSIEIVMREGCTAKISLDTVRSLQFFKLNRRFWVIPELRKSGGFRRSSNSVKKKEIFEDPQTPKKEIFERFSNSVEETPMKHIDFIHKIFLSLDFGNSSNMNSH